MSPRTMKGWVIRIGLLAGSSSMHPDFPIPDVIGDAFRIHFD
ncbi:hypothetical protein C7S14_4421 [Burkholderia cepacia]|nr:hypothetical protein C7S14_4421 [Burkholderia cepacia]